MTSFNLTQNLIHQIQKGCDVEQFKNQCANNPVYFSFEVIIQDTISMVDSEDRTLFYWACQEGKLDIAELFLDYGCDINKPDKVSVFCYKNLAFEHPTSLSM